MKAKTWEQTIYRTRIEGALVRALRRRRFAAVLVLLTFGTTLPLLGQTAPNGMRALDGMDHFISEQMQDWKVPGLAIAVVQNGQVIYSHGFGLRDVKNKLPVTTKTIFAIGSITKSFTAVSMGILNDEGKLDWDKPVRRYIPEFQMHDPVASERITPRDLISHRAGMAGHDVVWYSSDFSREDLVRRLRFLESNHDFRSQFSYNNLLVTTAGYMVGRISGQSWEDFIRQHIFTPVQMNSSNFSVVETQKSSDFAAPYSKDDQTGAILPIPFHGLEGVGSAGVGLVGVGPAGAINSNIEDMARYAIFQLGDGKVGDRQVVSEENLNLNHTPQVPLPGGVIFKEIGPASYGMGWGIMSYRGRAVWQHAGGIDGFLSLISLLPEERFGIVILTNLLGDNDVPQIVSYHLYDRLLGSETVDWGKRFHDLEDKARAAQQDARKKELAGRRSDTHLSHDVRAYSGRYENPGYGVLTVTAAADGHDFQATLNNLHLSLQHVEYDLFESPPGSTGALNIGKFRFLTDMDGNISGIAAPLEANAPEIVFTRVNEKTADSGKPK